MTEINQLERAKLAHKHGLIVQGNYMDGWYKAIHPTWSKHIDYRVHSDEEAKLDEIIFANSPADVRNAYISQSGDLWFLRGDAVPELEWELIAKREKPVLVDYHNHPHLKASKIAAVKRLADGILRDIELTDDQKNRIEGYTRGYISGLEIVG